MAAQNSDGVVEDDSIAAAHKKRVAKRHPFFELTRKANRVV